MSIQSELELNVTRKKLAKLRDRCEQVCRDSTGRPIDKLTLQSLMHMVNQLEEEIVLYESKVGTGAR